MCKKAIYAGSFNPITNGHIDVLKQALNIFDHVYLCVGNNPDKKYDIDINIRLLLCESAIEECGLSEKITVIEIKDTLPDVCVDLEIYNIIRGLRAVSDYEYEVSVGMAYKGISNQKKEIQLLYFMAKNENMFLSSSMVRNIYKANKQCVDFVPKSIDEYLTSLYHKGE